MTECCGNEPALETQVAKIPEMLTGFVSTPVGRIPRVATRWTRRDRAGHIKCRLSNSFRMSYSVDPGLYAVGSPGQSSPVFVTANYKLSFDHLRRAVDGLDAWVLVLNTRGINVWCAAAKGTFGNRELIARIQYSQLSEIVGHRRLILPQLAAPGIQAHVIEKQTGFSVHYGPVRDSDIPAYLDSEMNAPPAARAVRFSFGDRLVLTPMELIPALRFYLLYLISVFIVFGLQPQGIIFKAAMYDGYPFAILGFIALLSGTVLTPLFLPWIPFRSFALKGLLMGTVTTGIAIWLLRLPRRSSGYLLAFGFLLLPAASSYLALLFTGSTPFTGISGVKKELKTALPLYLSATGVFLVVLVLYKIHAWSLL